jgi:hypothetical protein
LRGGVKSARQNRQGRDGQYSFHKTPPHFTTPVVVSFVVVPSAGDATPPDRSPTRRRETGDHHTLSHLREATSPSSANGRARHLRPHENLYCDPRRGDHRLCHFPSPPP